MDALCTAGRQGRADPCGSGAHLAVRIGAVPCFAAQAERLTTLRAEAAGGEPFEMLDECVNSMLSQRGIFWQLCCAWKLRRVFDQARLVPQRTDSVDLRQRIVCTPASGRSDCALNEQ